MSVDGWACAYALIFMGLAWGVFRWASAFSQPFIYFSKVADVPPDNSLRANLQNHLSRYLTFAALGSFLVAFIDPHFVIQRTGTYNPEGIPLNEGIAIFLLLDQSGSMAQTITAKGSGNLNQNIAKFDLLKQVTKEFIQGDPSSKLGGRPADMIGMVKFARAAQVEVPLTLDHQEILKRLEVMKVVEREEDNGTAMGYAIYKTVSLIAATRHFSEDLINNHKPSYEMKDAIIIVVTDGFPSPNPLDKGRHLRNLDMEDAGAFAKQNDVHLYIVNIDPEFGLEEYAPNRRVLQKAAQETGGGFFMINSTMGLADIYREIDRLEKSRFSKQEFGEQRSLQIYRTFSFYPMFIGLGLMCLVLATCLETLIWRHLP